jgi:hypothetical protein
MPLQIEWLVPDEVIHIRYGEELTVDDLQEVTDTLLAIDPAIPQFHTLVNLTDIRHIRAPISRLKAAGQAVADLPNQGWTVVVRPTAIGARQVTAVTVELLGTLTRLKLKSFNEYDDAIAFLQDL